MSEMFEEIDSQSSPLGEISLRRRRIPAFGARDIYEVKLNNEFLMSSAFVAGEIALADLALEAVTGEDLKVVVGGLGLGYTANAVLKSIRVRDLVVVEALDTVIYWHQQELVPLGEALNADPRCRYAHGNFFEMAVNPDIGFEPGMPPEPADAILLDIDHSPTALLNERNSTFYTQTSLLQMTGLLRKGGVFAMWSNEPEDREFMDMLRSVFSSVSSHKVSFDNPLHGGKSSNTVYLSRK